MDLFDRVIQNVDRNQQNILITIPKSSDIEDDSVKMKIHLVDHSACFGMAKLNAGSIIASKFHCNQFAVIEFNPVDQARKFEQYLCKFAVTDRSLISKTLNRFAAIIDTQLNRWISKVQDFLSTIQSHRISEVLQRQRDTIQSTIANVKSNSIVTYFQKKYDYFNEITSESMTHKRSLLMRVFC